MQPWRVARTPGRRLFPSEEHPFLYVKPALRVLEGALPGSGENGDTQRIALLLGFSNLLIAGRYATG